MSRWNGWSVRLGPGSKRVRRVWDDPPHVSRRRAHDAVRSLPSDREVRAWGLAGNDGGLFWVQDFSLEGRPIDEVRDEMPLRTAVQVNVQGLSAGPYTVQPYDTWQGVYLDEISVECTEGEVCSIALPDFTSDMAFRIVRN